MYFILFIHSFIYLQGTQSLNPHNDYCQHFVDTGHRPQNFIRDVGECMLMFLCMYVILSTYVYVHVYDLGVCCGLGLADRFEEYPKLRELIRLKDELISTTNTPPMYVKWWCECQSKYVPNGKVWLCLEKIFWSKTTPVILSSQLFWKVQVLFKAWMSPCLGTSRLTQNTLTCRI